MKKIVNGRILETTIKEASDWSGDVVKFKDVKGLIKFLNDAGITTTHSNQFGEDFILVKMKDEVVALSIKGEAIFYD